MPTLIPVAQAGDDITEAHDQGRVADERADQGRLDQGDEALLHPEHTDQEVGRVAEGGIEQAAHFAAEAVGEDLGRRADERGERDHGAHREEELEPGRRAQGGGEQRGGDEQQERAHDAILAREGHARHAPRITHRAGRPGVAWCSIPVSIPQRGGPSLIVTARANEGTGTGQPARELPPDRPPHRPGTGYLCHPLSVG